MSGNKDFDTIIAKLPDNTTKANILHNLNKLTGESHKKYKDLVVDEYYKGFPDVKYLFFPDLYSHEIDQIHERMSYIKHDRVIRHSVKCKFCQGTNTFAKEEQRGGGDEYIPTRVTCHDCGKNYRM